MKIPNSDRKKALLVVDVQPRFLNDRMSYIVGNISSLISHYNYSGYVEGHIYAGDDSIWKKQHDWTSPKDGNMTTVEPLGAQLGKASALRIEKTTRSLFKGTPCLNSYLKENHITEVHIVGLDTYDCITATAHEAFDLGYFTYVIEECCQATSGQDLHERAIENLRYVNLTNNSCIEKIDFKEIAVAR